MVQWKYHQSARVFPNEWLMTDVRGLIKNGIFYAGTSIIVKASEASRVREFSKALSKGQK